jgi:pimeloyl-ACP methyl ester carboxylesterase
MTSMPLPIAAFVAASHVAPNLMAPFFRRMMLNPRRDVRPAPRLDLPEADERIDLDEGLVAWRWGEGPTVLLVHGFEGNRSQFGAVIEALLERGFSAVALDIPAHGESAGDELTAIKFISAIERTLDRLAPVHAVIGHSMGGAMALYTLAKHGGAANADRISEPS